MRRTLLLFSLFFLFCGDDEEKSLDEKACDCFERTAESVTCATKYIESASIKDDKVYDVDFREFVDMTGKSQGFGGYLKLSVDESGCYYCYLSNEEPMDVLMENPDYSPIDEGSEQFNFKKVDKKSPVEDCSKTDCRYEFELDRDSIYYLRFYPASSKQTRFLLYRDD